MWSVIVDSGGYTFLGPLFSAHFPRNAVDTPKKRAHVEKIGVTPARSQSPLAAATTPNSSMFEMCITDKPGQISYTKTHFTRNINIKM